MTTLTDRPVGTDDPSSSSRWKAAAVAGAVGLLLGFGIAWLLTGSDSADRSGVAEVEALVRDYIAAWDAGDGGAVVGLMTSDGVHTCPLGRFSLGQGREGLVAAVASMEGDDFEIVSGPILSSDKAPLEAVSLVRIDSPSVDILGIARHKVAEEGGQLRISVSEYTHF